MNDNTDFVRRDIHFLCTILDRIVALFLKAQTQEAEGMDDSEHWEHTHPLFDSFDREELGELKNAINSFKMGLK